LEEIIVGSPALADYRESEWEPLLFKILTANKQESKEGGTAVPGGATQFVKGGFIRGGFIRRGRTWMAAAAVLIFLVLCGWALLNRGKGGWSSVGATTRQPAVPDDVVPGGNKAMLTLADGSMINLDGKKNGLLVRQDGSRLVKEKDGQLAYMGDTRGEAPAKGGSSKVLSYNLLTTPKGGQYELILPDGSKVWLNAASSLRYPTSFTGKERLVELRGEAYFEIAKNAHMPFRVSVDRGLQVEVLGTIFNVKAYSDESFINTTLLQGSVKVHVKGQAVLVRPGERASLGGDGTLKAEAADTEEAVAWKNGLFRFNEATIEEVMRQLSRWYDVEVVYVNGPPKDLFRGEIYRNVNVSKVLKVLEASGIRFTVEGKKILVQK
jgi:transmembrane sensor